MKEKPTKRIYCTNCYLGGVNLVVPSQPAQPIQLVPGGAVQLGGVVLEICSENRARPLTNSARVIDTICHS